MIPSSLTASPEGIKEIFSPSGALSLQIAGYEERKEQQEMACTVAKAFDRSSIALIEAGTGTGKSLAYLIPAILLAQVQAEPIIISTNTIALQEQLMEKDIPLALKVLGRSINYILAKGMKNYVCLRKLQDVCSERSLFQDDFHEELLQIDSWSRTTSEGTRSSLPFMPSQGCWEQVAADADSCNNTRCSHFGKCFFFNARKEAQEARIIIVNHHLLFADLALRMETNNFSNMALLPAYKQLILDEAHHLEDVATEYFAEKVGRFDLLKTFSQLGQERKEAIPGRLALLKDRLEKCLKNNGITHELVHRLDHEIFSKKRMLLSLIAELFDAIATFCTLCLEKRTGQDQKLRIRKLHLTHPYWTSTLIPKAEELSLQLTDFVLALSQVEEEVTSLKNETVNEQTKSVRLDIKALLEKLSSFARRIKSFFSATDQGEKVYWIHTQTRQDTIEVQLVAARHDISELLKKNLFEKMTSSVLCSATLAADNTFTYIRSRVGLSSASLIEKIYPSPFVYSEQALFGCPSDMPAPDSEEYLAASNEAIKELVQASHGNAFVLFTSYEQLKSSYVALSDSLSNLGYHLLKQGDDHRQALIKRFKQQPRSILFGTDSFWEGVDIIGDALRCVIITKLPFPVPSDPISEARSELITAKGGSAFMEYSLPKAIVKFKQAFGRLIRHKNDRGSCICLDVRLLKKGYGKRFIQSLPTCYEVFEPLDSLKQKMRAFYRRRKTENS